MLNIICTIAIVYSVGDVNIMSEAQVKGHIIKVDQSNWLVDFSKEAKDKSYIGDYSTIIVPQNKCVRL